MKKFKSSLCAPIYALIVYAAIFAMRFVKPSALEYNGSAHLAVIIAQIVIFLIPAAIYVRLREENLRGKLNIKPFSPSKIPFVILCALALISLSAAIHIAQYKLFETQSFSLGAFDSFVKIPTEFDAGEALYMILTFAAIPAVTEEIAFRCVMLSDYTEGGSGAIIGCVATAVLYCGYSLDPYAIPVLFAAGLAYAFVTYVTGSCVSSMIVHLIFAIYRLFWEKQIVRIYKNPANTVFCIFITVSLFLIFFTAAAGEAQRIFSSDGKRGKKTPRFAEAKAEIAKSSGITPARIASEVFLSPSMIACVMFAAIAIYLNFA